MRTKHIIIDILEYLEAFAAEVPESVEVLNTTDFIGYLSTHHVHESAKGKELSGGKEPGLADEFTDNKVATDVAILIALLFRYAKMYIKKVLRESAIKTIDEFSFLITLLTHERMSKKDLIQSQVVEKTSGIEIINRMIKLGFITQSDDEHDKRRKLVRITSVGRSEILDLLPKMNEVSKLIVGNLTPNEQNMLHYIMRKLDHFHHEIYMQEKKLDLDKILEEFESNRKSL